MAKLTLEFHAGRCDVRLARTTFRHTRLPKDVYQDHEATGYVGRRGCQWRRGLQTLVLFLLRCRASADGSDPTSDCPEPPFAGRRPSFAATLNDLITRPSNTVNEIFGQVHGLPLFPELVRRENPDFNTDHDAEVKIWLRRDELAPEDIRVLIGDRAVENPGELQSLIENIESQLRRTMPAAGAQATDRRVPTSDDAPDPNTSRSSAGLELSSPWRDLFRELESTAGFGELDAAWGRVVQHLLPTASLPEGERQLPNGANGGRWGLLCECLMDARHGRWSLVLRKLRSTVQAMMDAADLAPADAVWAGRAANVVLQAAIRAREELTVRESLAWGDRLSQQFPAGIALRAQRFHYRARFHWRRRYGDLERAGQALRTAQRVYEDLPGDAPWRQIGLSQVLDSLGEYYADVGDAANAEQAFRESIRLKHELGDRYGQALSHGRLGRLFLEMQDLARAQMELLADLNLARQAQDARSESISLINLAEVFLAAAESDPVDCQDSLDRAASYLDDALVICRRIANRVGEGLTLVGRARALLLAEDLGQRELRRALEWTGQAYRILSRCGVRPEWKRYAQLWCGWAQAKLARTVQELDEADRRCFLPAIEDLRAAGLPMDLSEALFQRARMLASEGRRLGAAVGEQIADTLCQAVQHARLIRVPALARRYLALADCLDAQTWIDLLLAHKRSLAAVSADARHWQMLVEDRCHAVSLALGELEETVQPRTEPTLPQLDPEPVSANALQSVAAVRQRLGRLQRVLELVQYPPDDTGCTTPVGIAARLQDCSVLELVHDACQSLPDPDRDFGAHVKVDVDVALRWETVPDLLAIVIEIALRWASRRAVEGGNCLHLPRLLVRAEACDSQLRLDLFAATDPPDALATASLAEPEDAQADQRAPQRSEAADLTLARHFAQQLNGQIHIVPDPPEGWHTHLRICLEPVNPPSARGVAEDNS